MAVSYTHLDVYKRQALTDTDVKYLLLYFEQTYGLTSEKKMTAAHSIVANENCYHPIQDVYKRQGLLRM